MKLNVWIYIPISFWFFAVSCRTPLPAHGTTTAVQDLSADSPLFTQIRKSILATDPKHGPLLEKKLILPKANGIRRTPLIFGDQIFNMYAKLIEAAEHEVLIQSYVWRTDNDQHVRVVNALRQLAISNKPVAVKILVQSGNVTEDIEKLLQQEPFISSQLKVEILRFKKNLVTGALHCKTLIVDGAYAIITGANIERTQSGKNPWYDLGVLVKGDVAKSLRMEFFDAWIPNAYGVKPISVEERDQVLAGEKIPSVISSRSDFFDEDHDFLTNVPIIVAGRRENGAPNNDVSNPQDAAFLSVFKHARKLIRIQTPNLNDDHLIEAILSTLKRGVRIEIILSYGMNSLPESVPFQGGPNTTVARRLYKQVGVSEWPLLQIKWYAKIKGQAVRSNPLNLDDLSHAKYLSADNHLLILGSGNQDTQSWNHSREINLVIDSTELTTIFDNKIFSANFNKAVDYCFEREKQPECSRTRKTVTK